VKKSIRWRYSCAKKDFLPRTLIYATDINPHTLQKASAGVYEVERIAGFTEAHRKSGGNSSLSDYYTAAYGRAVFDKSLKEHIVFSDHSLATDSVFAEVQLISCRNVLIYFNRDLQDRAVDCFGTRYAVKLPRYWLEGSRCASAYTRIPSATWFPRSASTRSETVVIAAETLRARIDCVVIGCSAGGVEALAQLLPALPVTFRPTVSSFCICLANDRACWCRSSRGAAPGRSVKPATKEPIEPGTRIFRAAGLSHAG